MLTQVYLGDGFRTQLVFWMMNSFAVMVATGLLLEVNVEGAKPAEKHLEL